MMDVAKPILSGVTLAGALALLAGATVVPANAAPGWCINQRNLGPAERTICRSNQLSNLDRRLGTSYTDARSANPSGRNEIKAVQRAWLKRRNNCGSNRGCLVRLYEEQIDWLDGYGGRGFEPEFATGGDDIVNLWRTRGYQRCYDFVMSGRVEWGGGSQWRRENAAWLCEASTDVVEHPPEPVYCFRQQRSRGMDWQSAIRICRDNRGLVEGSAQQTENNRRNDKPPQRTGNNEYDNYDPAEENDGYDEPQYNAEGNEGVDHSEDYADRNPFCGWWAIYACHASRDRAIRDMNNNRYGGVVDTNDVPNFRNGYYCVADGPFPRKRRARNLRNRARGDYQSAYIKNGC